MKKHCDRHRRDVEFAVGEWVLLKLHKYRQQSLAKRLNFKLAKRYFGPYQILQKVGVMAYRLKLPDNSSIHPVFHVSLLKAYQGEPPTTVPTMPATLPTPSLYPVAIIDRRSTDTEGNRTLQVLVEWVGLPREDATWVSWTDLLKEFPASDLEDKVIVEGKDDDMDHEWEDPNMNEAQEEAQEERTHVQHAVRGHRTREAPKWTNDYHVEFRCNRMRHMNEVGSHASLK